MKKSLIALAVAGTFAAPAYAATANVDVYGVLNVAVESVDNGVNSKTRVTTGNNSSLGFKGSEDLGGGLKAIWQVEVNVSMDGDNNATSGTATASITVPVGTNTSTITYVSTAANPGGAGGLNGTRNTFLGLSGGFGTVLVGVHDTPYKLATGRLDNFGGTLGDYNSIMGAMGSGSNSASNLFDLRASNVVAYVSPNLQGFQARLGYVFSGEGNFTTANINKSNAWSLDVGYTKGPLFLTGAYEKHNLYGNAGAGGGQINLGNGTGAKTEREAWKLGGGYKFGDLSLGAVYENIEVGNKDRDAWMLSAGYAMGPVTLKAMYMNADDVSGSTNTGAKQWNLGVDYALSKRTMVQFVYANLDNDNGAEYQLGQGGNLVAGSKGKDQDGFAIGIRHSF